MQGGGVAKVVEMIRRSVRNYPKTRITIFAAILYNAVLVRERCRAARMVELVDTADSKSAASRRAGSIPALGTSYSAHNDSQYH